MEESDALAAAKANTDELAAAADRFKAYAEDVKRAPKWTDDYKRELVAAARQELSSYHESTRQATLDALDRAHQLATARLEAPVDADTEARKARAATRVGRLIDSGLGPAEAAAALAETGDVDALRALRDEVPSLVRVTITDAADAPARKAATANTLLAVDRVMAPLLDGPDGAAAQVRVQVDDERARLDATSGYAYEMERTSGAPSAAALLRLAYANPPEHVSERPEPA